DPICAGGTIRGRAKRHQLVRKRATRAISLSIDVLLTAAGFRLGVEPEPESLHKVRTHSAELIAKLAELGGHNISVFGSVARGDDRPDSDVDLLIDIDDTVGLFTLMKMRSVAERILGREVDLIPRNGLKASV